MLNENRRKYPRVVYPAQVTVTPLVKGAVSFSGIIKNISAGGLAFETESVLSPDGKYLFEFYLPDKDVIKSTGKTTWELKSKTSNFYGVEFKSMGFFGRLKLKRFVKNKLSEI